jgi:hypothetical protein
LTLAHWQRSSAIVTDANTWANLPVACVGAGVVGIADGRATACFLMRWLLLTGHLYHWHVALLSIAKHIVMYCYAVQLQVKLTTMLRVLLAGCGPPTSPALTGGLLRLAKELSWHSTNSPCMTLSLAVMARLREAADLNHFCDAGSALTVQAADLAHHMLRTFGEAP